MLGVHSVRSKIFFTKRKVYENYETVVANVIWVWPHQNKSSIVTMSSLFDMPDITFVIRKPLRTDARNDPSQYGVPIW